MTKKEKTELERIHTYGLILSLSDEQCEKFADELKKEVVAGRPPEM